MIVFCNGFLLFFFLVTPLLAGFSFGVEAGFNFTSSVSLKENWHASDHR